MASVEAESRHRDVLPSISHLDLDKLKSDRSENNKYNNMNGLSISTAPLGSPTTIYSGPPPPYSSNSSTAGSVHGLSGYISPPESTTRRSTKDEKESPGVRTSLPSIHEALGDRSITFSTPSHPVSTHQPNSAPPTALSSTFPDAPKGPPNPFSQPILSLTRDTSFSTQSQPSSATLSTDLQPQLPSSSSSQPTTAITSGQPPTSGGFAYPRSPRSSIAAPSVRPPLPFSSSSVHAPSEQSSARSPLHPDPSKPSFTFPQYSNSASGFAPVNEPYQFSGGSKYDDRRGTYPRSSNDPSYGDTVKRHLDVFDAELGLKEIGEASERTLNFSRIWAQRHHQNNRSGYYTDALPVLHEVDEVMRQSHRVLENLSRIREVVITQQNALSEERARLARGNHMEDDYNGLSDEYKGGGFAGGDAKKRRGKAAPPGRCHSCNRAETPEWRRGPDGARTLCNACGLHYAKLTRKMGVNKAAALTGSNLRPKNS